MRNTRRNDDRVSGRPLLGLIVFHYTVDTRSPDFLNSSAIGIIPHRFIQLPAEQSRAFAPDHVIKLTDFAVIEAVYRQRVLHWFVMQNERAEVGAVGYIHNARRPIASCRAHQGRGRGLWNKRKFSRHAGRSWFAWRRCGLGWCLFWSLSPNTGLERLVGWDQL